MHIYLLKMNWQMCTSLGDWVWVTNDQEWWSEIEIL